MSTAALVVPIVYNLSIQLRPEQLADARRRWRENAPADYDLAILVKRSHDDLESRDQEDFVEVRAGRVVLAVRNNEVLYLDPSLSVVAGPAIAALSSEGPERYGVPPLFDEIDAALRRDQKAERRNFATARFDPMDGHPYHYVHRVRGTRDRVEWNVKLKRVAAPRR